VGCFELPLVAILSESLAGVMIPRLSELVRSGDHREVVRATVDILRSLALVHFALYAFFLACGRVFLTALFTDAYAASWPIFAANLTLLPFSVLMLDPIVRAYPRYRYFLLRIRMLSIAVLIALLWVGTTKLGPLGAILAMVAVTIGERIVLTIKIARDLGLRAEDWQGVREASWIALAAALAGVATAIGQALLVKGAPLLILACCALIFTTVYLVAI